MPPLPLTLLNGVKLISYTVIKNHRYCVKYICVLECSPGDVSGQLTAAPPTCPGGTITFTCNVAGVNGITIWRVGGSRNLCILSHISTSPATCGENNDFRATPGTGFGTNVTTLYSSTLSGNATYALDGALVECFGPVNSVDTGNRVNGSTLWTLGQCKSFYCIVP